MNKKFILFVLLASNAFVLKAQKFQGSVLAGFTTSQVSGDSLSGFNKSGFMAGGAVTLPLSKKFNMGIEITLIQKGSKRPNDPEKEDYRYYRMHLNYAEVPIVFEYVSSKRFRFHIAPTIGALLSSKEEDEYGEIPENQTSSFEKYELGISGGLSFFFSEKINIKLRISQSVLPIRNVGADTRYVDSGQYNSLLAFMLQYHFVKSAKQATE